LLFKSKYTEPTDKEINTKKEINRMMSDCSQEQLDYVMNFIAAIKK
jgi:hypothetical protein